MSGQQIEHLVSMANQIALNFGEKRNLIEAARKTGEHLEKFWTRAMREKLSIEAAGSEVPLSPAVNLMLEQQRGQIGS